MSQPGAAGLHSGQIIIVRRNQDLEDSHHGGVWKIAFADFMTAMMAFFLVMWLTNASDDATKKQIAQYFNPIKLNSSSPDTLGLDSGKSTPPTPSPSPAKGEVPEGGSPGESMTSGTATGGAEQALFKDPYAVLAEIAAEGGPGVVNGVPGVPDGSGLPGLNGGEAYRDPFDPAAWQLEPNIEARTDKEEDPNATLSAQQDTQAIPSAGTTTVAELVTPASAEAAAEPAAPASAAPETASAEHAAADKKASEAENLKAEIEKTMAGTAPGSAPGVEVSAGENGITISLADSLTSGMFEIGSAKPTPQAVALVEKIAKILQERPGTIVVRGHTDSRPYVGDEYDNWRLSSARAQFAYYMLVHGGLDEKRVESIEGFADRQPKDPANPESAVNRRIEILLIEPKA